MSSAEVTSFSNASRIITQSVPIPDGSWDLKVLVTDLQVERVLRVHGDLHVGGVMIQLVDELGKNTKTHPFMIGSRKVRPEKKR